MGAALAHPDIDVVGVELIPEVLDAVALFSEENRNVRSDPRARLIADDARSYLLATHDRYDVILSDLFLPWTAGTASLYSRELYELGRDHLQPGGIYCQWLPLHQLAVDDLESIVATFASVFPYVELWLAYHRSDTPLAALLGSASPLAQSDTRQRPAGTQLRDALHFAGLDEPDDVAVLYVTDGERLRAATRDVQVITDDRPGLEFSAPESYFRQPALAREALAWVTTLVAPGPAPVAAAAAGAADVRRALRAAQLALVSGQRARELESYLQALALAPQTPAVRRALLAIARERARAGDRETSLAIASAVRRAAPHSVEAAQLATLTGSS
jgi:spermidine synthase